MRLLVEELNTKGNANDNDEPELKSPRDMHESTQQTKEVFRPTIQLRNRFSVLSVDDNYPTDEDNGEIEIEHTMQPTAKKHLTTDQDASPVTKHRNNKVNQNDYNRSTTDGTTQTDCRNHNKTTKEKQSNRDPNGISDANYRNNETDGIHQAGNQNRANVVIVGDST